ncbi:pyridoxal 5'-phosphate synthase glutaminase subunit PdxT [Pseudokineococcus marinus]|uniref:Pyridoxal 5'-phosphate synthase subunit PdxT n=1 Tax=Pseudokineococcus marinus TaxID=351215 RepID=A0A849BSF1_9ACTN|nr:pyridoxal 5'-phosphate synthase glutaminase subunit PdxT [Pseudokineococcus marinus]NNH24485.1 pyridoxal 5'-phosphate synthase glutaminase subunit PdxT [Pseudokineococcus marinus]
MSAAPVIGVLGLQGDSREHLAALRAAGAEAVVVRRPEELASVHGLVLPGGESTVIDKLLRVFELREPLVRRIREGLPVYGSCAGMILLADRLLDGTRDQQTLGGLDVTVRRNAFGRQVDSFETDLEITGVSDRAWPDPDGAAAAVAPGPVHAVFIRAPWVEEAGPDVEALGVVPAGPAAGTIVAVRAGNLLATSFHPEITGDTRVHRLFAEIVRAA